MLNTHLDHLVVAAATLEAGVDFVHTRLGVEVPPGGRHDMMGTHNCVMSLGGNTYLEIIAVDPEIQPPERPRWFGLDDPSVIRSLSHSPQLITWAVNTNDLAALARLSPLPAGEIRSAERDDLRWQVALPEDGRLGAGGFFPLCIQWQMDFHPSTRMADLGCRLLDLTLYHAYPGWLGNILEKIGAANAVRIMEVDHPSEARLCARIHSPLGEVTLSSQ